MEDKKVKLNIGALLHDIGKVLYRYNDGRNHSQSGYEYLKNQIRISDKEILEQVKYHHASYLKNANIDKKSLAYITYIADNIASGSDRRKNEDEFGFNQEQPLESIFNLLNNNEQKYVYAPQQLNEKINYPSEKITNYDKSFYGKIVSHLEQNLCSIEYTEDYLNSLLEVLETELTYIPSSTATAEVADISLYDHVKLTAAFASCIEAWLEENEIDDYHECLFVHAEKFYKKKAFLMYSMDISGIQDFIYTIVSEDALKSLRARSFYLEILMENLIDELLLKLEFSRANVIYSGGGHAYFILPNTACAREQLKVFEEEVNGWLAEHFQTALYLGCGYAECSAMDLQNQPEGAYRNIFKNISAMISKNKAHRYSASRLIELNERNTADGMRECKVCRSIERLTEDNICSICDSLIKMSGRILTKSLYAVTEQKEITPALPLPFARMLIAEDEKTMLEMIKNNQIIRIYTKNEPYTGTCIAKRLWIGDYTNKETFEELAEHSEGINRIAVLRADVDNLGNAFVNGFSHEKFGEKYMTISRTATFSRKMSIFFKYHINALLKKGQYYIKADSNEKERAITIVYAGGDDVFIVGSWDEVIGFAIDLTDSFKEFTQGKLSLSGGIGIYPKKYPISTIAREVGELEEAAKGYPGKNAVALFNENLVFNWEELEENVLEEKLYFIRSFFDVVPDKGKAFLYKLLELLRGIECDEKNNEGKINLARLAYLIARLEESYNKKENCPDMPNLSKNIYQWSKKAQDRKCLIAAIYIYVYLNREKEK